MIYHILDKQTGENPSFPNLAIAAFLETQLGVYGDNKVDILKCLDYVFEKGGLVILAEEGGYLAGAAVLNETGMQSYIPENILVYIAVHENQRGKGLGTQLMQKCLELAEGSIALHVEADNPAKKLYEKLGFTNKYLEMRLQR
ncbi:GNAT family acetyltransferase [Pelobium manganitolerans]|uniref:GNAT family acetyltransferase n=1 Tax=Pelobium manganitolerans TaxID=1842495 RepID=A0A419S383_9SPHI|nr:GNAT family N-acetyltransferase [Pelobium manganitolerans]RKD13753.1 GNAT family acetyltransferase [Pelobium manganitolerans]